MKPGSDAGGHASSQRGRALRWPVVCWLIVLVLIGIVQVVREDVFDTVAFGVAIVLVIASILLPQRADRGVHTSVIAITATALAVAVALLPRHSPGMVAAVLVTGVVALISGWAGTASAVHRWTPGLHRLAVAWAVILVVGCLWELAQFIVGRLAPTQPSFALSDLVDPLLDVPLGKAVFAMAWLACGVFLVLRGRGTR
ncbi:hypothetical protein [uncultured Microbacterium sp.]|uniref:hypothetical protein n=1 Tax=uncultured Microbacterium sp. TaxID=191216 RepID=UPI002601E603|nr:hypothetical protein [uncultured Microbacterium sp.]